ncbi:MAG: hypothetical protein OEL85_07145, partial [Desulfobulbaceae bacterium]|nr:hypothetical protein [Desulfobulbaceae bacterium]
ILQSRNRKDCALKGVEMANILSLFEESKKFVAGEVLIHEGEENRDLLFFRKVSLKSHCRMNRKRS